MPKGRAGDIGAPILSTEALDDRIAIVGTAGSGKTYAAKGFVERLLVAGARVTVVDPLGVWWGLRASADGATPGYPVVVFGGRHADVAITAEMGAAFGRLIAGQALACVVDLSELGSSAARRRFMAAFADALYEANEEPLHLVLDEADLWAPQRPIKGWEGLLGHIYSRRKHLAGRQRDILGASFDARHVALRHPETHRECSLAEPGPPARLAQMPPEFGEAAGAGAVARLWWRKLRRK